MEVKIVFRIPACNVYDKNDQYIGYCNGMETTANTPQEAMRNFRYRYNKANHRPTYEPAYFSAKMVSTKKQVF